MVEQKLEMQNLLKDDQKDLFSNLQHHHRHVHQHLHQQLQDTQHLQDMYQKVLLHQTLLLM